MPEVWFSIVEDLGVRSWRTIRGRVDAAALRDPGSLFTSRRQRLDAGQARRLDADREGQRRRREAVALCSAAHGASFTYDRWAEVWPLTPARTRAGACPYASGRQLDPHPADRVVALQHRGTASAAEIGTGLIEAVTRAERFFPMLREPNRSMTWTALMKRRDRDRLASGAVAGDDRLQAMRVVMADGLTGRGRL